MADYLKPSSPNAFAYRAGDGRASVDPDRRRYWRGRLGREPSEHELLTLPATEWAPMPSSDPDAVWPTTIRDASVPTVPLEVAVPRLEGETPTEWWRRALTRIVG